MSDVKKSSVLIVDDDSSNIMALTEFLKDDYTLYVVKSGQRGIEVAQDKLPDIILLDIVMPDMDGYDVITALMESEITQDIPVIFITSLNDVGDEEKGLALGAMDYIVKPFSSAIVKLRVQNQLKYIEQTRLIMEKENAEKKLAAESAALERANQMKTDIMQTISHETRTPLAVIMSYSEVTARDARKKGMEKEFVANLDTIAAEARRTAEMMEDLRQIGFSKASAKERIPIEIGVAITRIAELYKKVFELKNIKLISNIPQDLPSVYANEGELSQVMINLLRNAEKHTENGTVEICGECSGGEVIISISDTGTGISPELLPHIFERGVCGSENDTGYGLAICKDILDAHGGSIRAESDGVSGTDVTFTLPVYNAERS